MTVNCSMYYSTFREEKGNYLLRLPKLLPKGWHLGVVFKYKYAGLDDGDVADITKYFLYDNFKDLNEKEINDAEKLVTMPFSHIRMRAKTAFLRYPNMKNLPDDEYIANCALAWAKFFKTQKIDVFLTGLMDETPAIVGLEVAKKMGIPVLMLHPSRFTCSFFLCDGDYGPIFWKRLTNKEINEQYELAKKEIMGEKIINAHIASIATNTFDVSKLKVLFQLLSAVPRNFYTYYIVIPKDDRKLWYSTLELIAKQFRYFIRSRLYGFFMDKTTGEDEKFIFFPLHFTDDAALTAKFALDSQFDLIEKLSKLLPHDTYIYVKPHPHWKACDVPLGIMRRMAKNPKIRLVSYNADTKQLVKKAEFTVIINSAVGFEALLAGKPVVAFGQDYPVEVMPRVKDVAEVFGAFRKQASPETVKKFIADMRAHSFHMDGSVFATAEIYSDNDIQDIVRHFQEAYEAIKARGNG